jgi:hypothetical protein
MSQDDVLAAPQTVTVAELRAEIRNSMRYAYMLFRGWSSPFPYVSQKTPSLTFSPSLQ